MAIPLLLGSKVRVGIWIGEKKCWAIGKVTNSTPGFGFGIHFTEIADTDASQLTDFLKTIKED
jgi:hypothetical protein